MEAGAGWPGALVRYAVQENFSNGSFSDYRAYYTGIAGQIYSGLEVDATAGGVLTRSVYTGVTGTPFSAFEQDFTAGALSGTKFEFTNISGGTYYAYEVEQDASSALRAETLFNTDGSHSVYGFQNGITLAALGNDTMTGGGASVVFDLQSVFGHDTINDFYQHMTGAGHDLIKLSASDFGSAAAAVSTLAQDVAGGVMITGQSGSTLTLQGLNKATLGALAADFLVV